MSRGILPFLLVAAALAACSKSEPPAASKPRPAAEEAEAQPAVRVEAEPARPDPFEPPQGALPPGFPYEIMEGDRIRGSSSFTVDGLVHYDVSLLSEGEPEEVANHWQGALEKRGIRVVRQRVDAEDHERIVLFGEDDEGVFHRVGILRATAAEGEEARPVKVNVYIGKR